MLMIRRRYAMPLEPRNEDENTKAIKKKLNQIEAQLKQIGDNLQKEPNDLNNNVLENVLNQQDLLMRNLEKLESNENARHKQNEELKNELEDSISTFKQAIDTKFKAIDKQTDQLIRELKKRNEQAENEIQTYKQTLENKMSQNDQLIQKYNKTLSKMTHGLFALFYVVLVVALVAMVT